MSDYDVEVLTPMDRARNGARFLDSYSPGWHNKIDVSVLDVSSAWFCIVGQLKLWNDYSDEFSVVARYDSFTDHGFGARSCASVDEMKKDYLELTDAWKTLIGVRRVMD